LQSEHAGGKGKVDLITKLRGVAALSVFLFHLICLSNGYISNKLLNTVFFYGKYGVQFFFVISGFVITYSLIGGNYVISDFFIFLKKRVIRIEPPYLITLMLTVAFLYIRARSGIANGAVEVPGWRQILLHIGYLVSFSNYQWLSIVFWTLAIEFQFYLSFSLLFTWFVKNQYARWVISLLFILLYFLPVLLDVFQFL